MIIPLLVNKQVNLKILKVTAIIFVSLFSINDHTQARVNSVGINLEAKQTITPVKLSHGEIVEYIRKDSGTLRIELLSTSANILYTNRDKIPNGEPVGGRGNQYRARLLYEITADVLVNDLPMTMRKYVGSQESFYEPYVINGVRIWFDAVSDIFEQDGGFLSTARNADGRGNLIVDDKPNKNARFVFQDMTNRIAPGEIHAWFKDSAYRDKNFIYKENFIDIGRTFNGDDVYLGAYLGGESHGALDINMEMNSLMYAPFDLDEQEGIRAEGTKTWPDGSTWAINTGHVIEKYVPDNTPVKGGTPYGRGARRACWWHPHAHFGFEIIESGIRYDIDPWILLHTIFLDRSSVSWMGMA